MTLFSASDTIDQSAPIPAAQDLTSTVRYLASLKNIQLTPDQSAALARTTSEHFATWNQQQAHGDARQLGVLTTKAIDRTLDIVAAARVIRLAAQMIEGNSEPDNSELTKRATAIVDRFIGANATGMHRWPDPYETFRTHYGSVPWGPVHHTLADGTKTTTYLLDELMHRDPKEGPAFQCWTEDWSCSQYLVQGQKHRDYREGPAVIQECQSGSWFRSEEYYEQGVLHRPATEGPAVIWTDHAGNRTFEAYYEDGELHRDPKQGPAWHRIDVLGERSEYLVNGKLHRDHRDGPAIIDSNFMGKGLAVTEYWKDGQSHRPVSEGPAYCAKDHDGQVMGEIYGEDGEMHRDPKQGPARYFKDHLGEEREYAVNGKRHRDAADGPAFIFTYADGTPVRGEEYYKDGKWHRPASEGPAILQTDPSGKRLFEIYVEDGEPHRDPATGPAWYSAENGVEDIRYQVRSVFHRDERDGPARIHIDEATGTVLLAEYSYEGRSHRTNGPARIERNAGGVVIFECWFRDGEFDRDPADGPAFIMRDDDGAIVEQAYWVRGERIETATPSAGNRATRRKAKKRNRKVSRRSNRVTTAEACDG